MIGKLVDLKKGPENSQLVTLALKADFRDAFDELKDSDVNVEIKKYRKGRSLEANGFAWSLIGKISERMQRIEPEGRWTPLKVYQDTIREVGGICTKGEMEADAVETFRRIWVSGHLGRQLEITGEGEEEGSVEFLLWYGSSDFDTAQMSQLIGLLIQQAESIGIPTITDDEVERMLGNWGKKKEKEYAASHEREHSEQ